MKDLHVLRELEQIKAISQVYRLEVLDAFQNQPATAKQVSERMGEPHAKVNYHIKTLVKVGILELVEEVVKLGIVEKYYAPVAKNFIIDSSVMNPEDETLSASLKSASIALFERIAKDFYASVEKAEKKDPPKKIAYNAEVFLTQEEARELEQAVNKLVGDFLADKQVQREDTKKYFTANLIIPTK